MMARHTRAGREHGLVAAGQVAAAARAHAQLRADGIAVGGAHPLVRYEHRREQVEAKQAGEEEAYATMQQRQGGGHALLVPVVLVELGDDGDVAAHVDAA